MSSDPTATTDTGNVIPLQTQDQLINLVTGMGGSNDPLSATRHVLSDRIPMLEADALYLNDWLGAAVVDTIPDDAVRQWREISGLEPKQLDEYREAEKAFQVSQIFAQGMKWARLYGGAGIVMGIDGTGEFHEPLDIERVRPGALKWLSLVDRWHLLPHVTDFSNPLRANFGRPSVYTAYGGHDPIHRSRILFFYGTPLPYHLQLREQFWGASVLERVKDAIEHAGIAQNGIAKLITEAKVDVFKLPGLFEKLRTPQGTQLIMERLRLGNLGKGIYNAVLMDTAEEYEQKADALSQGLAGLLSQFLQVVAAASGIPVTRLLGTSAPGLNATGEEDTRKYYDRVSTIQENVIEPELKRFDAVLLRSTLGSEPDKFESTFKSLWQQSDTERAATQLQDQQRDSGYLADGIILESHILERLLEEGVYPTLEASDAAELKKTQAAYGEGSDNLEGDLATLFGGNKPPGEEEQE